jgi:DNA-binding transcriptional LysR family regulator
MGNGLLIPVAKKFPAKSPKFDDETLRTFLCVAQLHSFSAAAEALNKTTSTISYRIKAMD